MQVGRAERLHQVSLGRPQREPAASAALTHAVSVGEDGAAPEDTCVSEVNCSPPASQPLQSHDGAGVLQGAFDGFGE